jgi:hypothetical protein
MEVIELLCGPVLFQRLHKDDRDRWIWKAAITGRLWVQRQGQNKEEVWQRNFVGLGNTSEQAVDAAKEDLRLHSPHPMFKWMSPDEMNLDPSWYRRQAVASIEPTIKH